MAFGGIRYLVGLALVLFLSLSVAKAAEIKTYADEATTREVVTALDRLGKLVRQKDLKVLDEFTDHAILVGSDKGEMADGRDALRAFFSTFFAQPLTAGWDWTSIRIDASNTIAWVFAEGDLVVQSGRSTERSPYRLSAVLERRDGRWLWREFNGSEPKKLTRE